ncbi:hypothetical protein Dsin_013061 [Dipteronia sinensis]|uniref:Uncharacterized protein n=1 Tax=Dipteronia sinensis TaxID=43782 RepID=A0AAE0AJF6_9ROSI|nr:hypothetical protein Dsin_013061 [Dipteronia sinensis]
MSISILFEDGIKVEQITPPTPSGDNGIGLEQLASITRDLNFSALEHYGWICCSLLFISVLHLIEVSLGSLATFNPYLDCSCHSFTGSGSGIKTEVMRGGKTVKISIFEIVVGDVISLRIGDQMESWLPVILLPLMNLT